MKLTILGCGTSGGVPKIPEYWGACDPAEPKNRRQRASVFVEEGDTHILIDTSPDLRSQILTNKINKIDAVFYTHEHADHTHGIDELRGFHQATGAKIPMFADAETMALLKSKFDYIFKGVRGYPSVGTGTAINGPKQVGQIKMIPFEQGHGSGISLGYRFGDMAYSTDLNRMPETAFEALQGVKIWVVDALRYDPHPTHSHLAQTLEWIEQVKPDLAVLTHMTWDMDYQTLKRKLPSGVVPAYDGMVLEL
ncbi:phosphoribosyl 1,2-cyclic phosphodiesterase [Kordiimonas sediminis]|uniref:Phosphoribosyl 1,2-cyclic phosphodiesterase n=1 Tax=Kordiimonas sediminis TaxID=1735581 RepID=A0A919AXG6_9PROT|nr:MBL fold metallo-hydrolase [Kordiimonas sediminis]GHF28130.1 phosphoribosyl 1,2-cyclic phosphodiesterase [Kordiimonas sediminis]